MFRLDISEIRRPYYYGDNKPKQTTTSIVPNDVYAKIYSQREKIMKLFDNDENDNINIILNNLDIHTMNIISSTYIQIPISEIDHSIMFQNSLADTNTDKYISNKVNDELFAYSINYPDIEFFQKIISKNNRADLFCRGDNFSIQNDFIQIIVLNDNLCRIILDNMDIRSETIASFIYHAIQSQRLCMIDMFSKYGYCMDISQIEFALKLNCVYIVEYAILNNYDIQNLFNNYDICTFDYKILLKYNLPRLDIYELGISMDMVKLFTKYGIDLSSKINFILQDASRLNQLDLVTYCIESGYDCDINLALKSSFRANKINIMTYLLQNGADINSIDDFDLRFNNSETINLLIKYGYVVPLSNITRAFMTEFVCTDNILNIMWLIEYGADPLFIFDRENYRRDHPVRMFHWHEKCEEFDSYLEYLVSMGKISHIKYLADTYIDKLQPELDRLVIIACANGQISMVEFLLDLGADITAVDNLALKSACYFGQIAIVKLILNRGIDIHSVTDNLFMFVAYGPADKECFHTDTSYYKKLVEDNLIFRNDAYHYEKSHADIINLLIEMNYIPPPAVIFGILVVELLTTELITHMITNNIDIRGSFPRHPNSILPDKRFRNFCSKPICILELSVMMNNYEVTKLLLGNGMEVDNNLIAITEEFNYTEIKQLLLEYIPD